MKTKLAVNISDSLKAGDGPLVLDTGRIRELVLANLDSSLQERKKNMNRIKTWKTILLAAALLLAFGVCAYAAGKPAGTFSSGPSEEAPSYQTVEKARHAMEKEGYTPVCPEAFPNGYTFNSGSLIENQILDGENQNIESYRSFNFKYEKNGDLVYLNQEKYLTEPSESSAQIQRIVNGITLNYDSSTHKMVPLDYVPTPEEEEAQKAGILHFGYTEFVPGEEILVSKTQIVFWQIGKTHYTLYQMNGVLSSEELLAMAEDLLSKV